MLKPFPQYLGHIKQMAGQDLVHRWNPGLQSDPSSPPFLHLFSSQFFVSACSRLFTYSCTRRILSYFYTGDSSPWLPLGQKDSIPDPRESSYILETSPWSFACSLLKAMLLWISYVISQVIRNSEELSFPLVCKVIKQSLIVSWMLSCHLIMK